MQKRLRFLPALPKEFIADLETTLGAIERELASVDDRWLETTETIMARDEADFVRSILEELDSGPRELIKLEEVLLHDRIDLRAVNGDSVVRSSRPEGVPRDGVRRVDVGTRVHDDRDVVPELEREHVVVAVAAVPVLTDVTAPHHYVSVSAAQHEEPAKREGPRPVVETEWQ